MAVKWPWNKGRHARNNRTGPVTQGDLIVAWMTRETTGKCRHPYIEGSILNPAGWDCLTCSRPMLYRPARSRVVERTDKGLVLDGDK